MLEPRQIKYLLKEHGIDSMRVPRSRKILAVHPDGTFTDVTAYTIEDLRQFLGYESQWTI